MYYPGRLTRGTFSSTEFEREGLAKWVPMAIALTTYLERAVGGERIENDSLPITLHHAAVYFFAVAKSAAEDEAPTNPRAGIANYCIAADTIRATLPAGEHDRDEISTRLTRYTEFAKSLRQPRVLAAEDLQTARELTVFFHHLASAGKSERYERFAGPQREPSQLTGGL